VRRALIVVAAVGLLVAAGCGGGGTKTSGESTTTVSKPTGGRAKPVTTPSAPPLTKAQYQAKLKQIAADVSKRLGRTSSSKKVTEADVDRFVKVIHSFADRIEAVNPPAAVKALHRRLVGAMNDLADEFPGIARKLNDAKDPSEAIAALFAAKSVQELAKLQRAYKAKGYTLDLSS
jgi:hypothetical protein